MGAAKQRGSREQRIAESIAKREEVELARRKHLAELEAAMTPEERKKRSHARKTLTMMAGFTAGRLAR